MSVFDSKVYPTLARTPEDLDTAQNYRLQTVGEIEKLFLNKIEKCEKLAKKVRRIRKSILFAEKGLIIPTGITESTFLAAFTSGVAITV